MPRAIFTVPCGNQIVLLNRPPAIVVDNSPLQPAIPFEGNLRPGKEDCKQNHANDYKELKKKEGKQKYDEHLSLDPQRFVGSQSERRPDALRASRTPRREGQG